MFTCRDAAHLMTDEREGAPASRSFAYRFHMMLCPYCKRCRRQLAATIALTGEIPAEAPPSAVENAALQAFRDRAAKR